MVMYKLVNGIRIRMSDEEEQAILAERELALQEYEAKAQENAIKQMVAQNKASGLRVLDVFMFYLAQQEASIDKLKDITKKHLDIYILLQNGGLQSALSAIDDVNLDDTLVSKEDFDYLKLLINTELS